MNKEKQQQKKHIIRLCLLHSPWHLQSASSPDLFRANKNAKSYGRAKSDICKATCPSSLRLDDELQLVDT